MNTEGLMNTTKTIATGIVLATMAAALAGCTPTVPGDGRATSKPVSIGGYKIGAPEKRDGITAINIPRVTIDSSIREPHLQTEFTSVIINEFTKEQSYQVVPSAEDADGTLKVEIKDIKMDSVRYVDKAQNAQARGVPVEYVILVHADVTMVDTRSGEALWHIPGMRGRYDFTPAGDFGDAKREALLQACGDLAREIVDAASEQW